LQQAFPIRQARNSILAVHIESVSPDQHVLPLDVAEKLCGIEAAVVGDVSALVNGDGLRKFAANRGNSDV